MSVDYKEKYLKYKLKYLNLKKQFGGNRIPDRLPATQSWLYMPIILLPFNDVVVRFPDRFNFMLNELTNGKIRNVDELKRILRSFYENKRIDLNDRRTIQTVGGYNFDDRDNLHLSGEEQERLLTDIKLHDISIFGAIPTANTREFLETIINSIMSELSGQEIEFRIR